MAEEAKRWWEQAKSDLKAAQDSITTNHYDWACFQAQQAAEKGLKALLLKNGARIRKIHDLVFLAKELELPEEIMGYCRQLARIYAETRYPESGETIPANKFSPKDGQYFVALGEKILQWLEKKL